MSIWNELSGISFKQYFVEPASTIRVLTQLAKGEPLILLHGVAGHIEAYARNIKSLSEHFRVIVKLDMQGHGYTGKLDSPYTLDEYGDHLLSNLKRFH
ncbi:alpha-beta hydrolase superfamily lysophospholipase [Neobacillus niacini]|uniref:alpha/beta fold hydrolase n=1 Tax=Neobacillus niacini TaxID=86668 RepID=UPI00277DD7DC|nr:hypothetical protein [Neobacillus niacini]MDQ1005190.1 alpha-beta hydrolase superfamily lysophospholipase [Neobacillus niacini]